MIEITDSAANAIRTAIAGSNAPVQGLRLMVETGGCAGDKYMMGLVAEPLPGDVTVEKGEIQSICRRVQRAPSPGGDGGFPRQRRRRRIHIYQSECNVELRLRQIVRLTGRDRNRVPTEKRRR